MAGWLAEAARAGWKPSAIIPDALLLPAPASGWTVAQDGGRGAPVDCYHISRRQLLLETAKCALALQAFCAFS